MSPRLQDRLVGLGLALPAAAVLSVARILTPDPAGLGTHRQLGLGGCAMLTTTGIPCPMCGMTTTFSHLAHLEPIQAVLTQPFGVVLFAGTVGAFAVGMADLVLPRGRWRRVLAWVDRHELAVAGSLLLGLVLGWAYKIAVTAEILSGVG
ncbi:MAG: DUF2752 domain-containing protein [Deltaproteobacteria bacterium]|nr:MAG: DUF2752 domain-containing protein [Deltaproteobacteria bacterium]